LAIEVAKVLRHYFTHLLLNLINGLRFDSTSRFFELGLGTMEVSAITSYKDLAMLKRYTHLKAEDLTKKLGQPNVGKRKKSPCFSLTCRPIRHLHAICRN